MIFIGTFLSVAGFIIRVVSVRRLKENFSFRVILPKTLVTSGVYKYVRHPMYLGALIMYFGLFLLITRSVATSVLFNIFTINFVIDRIDREEQLMIYKFGNKYVEYMKKTKMIVPFIF